MCARRLNALGAGPAQRRTKESFTSHHALFVAIRAHVGRAVTSRYAALDHDRVAQARNLVCTCLARGYFTCSRPAGLEPAQVGPPDPALPSVYNDKVPLDVGAALATRLLVF